MAQMQNGKLALRYPVIVEGKYDKITLSSIFETTVFCTGGFSVFNNVELRALLRAAAEKTPLLLLTDSDGGGKQIRAYLSGILPPERLIHLYIPEIPGKEKRKAKPGKAGLLGVEGMTPELLRTVFSPFLLDPATDGEVAPRREITKTDLFTAGLSGGAGSSEKRKEIAKQLGLPGDLSANALLDALNILCTYDEYQALIGRAGGEEIG